MRFTKMQREKQVLTRTQQLYKMQILYDTGSRKVDIWVNSATIRSYLFKFRYFILVASPPLM